MKKTLNDIFDEAKANEIEILVNQNAAADVSAATLSSIKNKVYAKTGITNKKKRIAFRWQSFVAAAAACLLLIVGGIFGVSSITKRFNGNPPPVETSTDETTPNQNPDTSDCTDNQGPESEDPETEDPGNDDPETEDPGSNRPEASENINNGVLKEVAAENMNVPENMKFLGTVNATEENNSVNIEATAVLYYLDGSVVNWTTEDDYIYVITSANNRLVMIDTVNMCPVYNTPLSGNPAEMNIIGDKIYISFPDLCRIDIFSKFDCTKESSLYFDHEVSSFCIDGDTIYYSEHDQHCKVFKKNLITNQLDTIKRDNIDASFYYPKIFLNKEDGILYVGESQSGGSALYYYDANTLTLKSVFKKNDYGIMNHTREIFHIGNEIFWGDYRLSDTNAKELIGKYGTKDYGSTVFASEYVVSTHVGLYLTDTYECVIDYFEAGFDFKHLIVTESYNVFFRKSSGDQNMIIGVNFQIQDDLKIL